MNELGARGGRIFGDIEALRALAARSDRSMWIVERPVRAFTSRRGQRPLALEADCGSIQRTWLGG